jgi:hypothetical protein
MGHGRMKIRVGYFFITIKSNKELRTCDVKAFEFYLWRKLHG